jgi:hypothetical protein
MSRTRSRILSLLLAPLLAIVALALPLSASAAVPDSVTVWGDNGHGVVSDYAAAIGSHGVKQVAFEYNYGLALLDDGSVVGWGDAADGQLSIPDFTGKTVVKIGAAQLWGFALLDDGTLETWHGPYWDSGLADVDAINAGGTIVDFSVNHTVGIVLYDDGHVATWGTDTLTTVNGGSAAALGDATYTAVAIGGVFGLAVRDDGHLVVWGSTDPPVTEAPSGDLGSPIVEIATGFYHGMVLLADGSVLAWGYDNNDVVSGTAAAINGRTVTDIVAGYLSSMALFDDGTFAVWGSDAHGGVSGAPAGAGAPSAARVFGGYSNLAIVTATPDLQVTSGGHVVHNDDGIAPGSEIDVAGDHLTRNADWQLTVDGVLVDDGNTSEAGTVSTSYTVPEDAAPGDFTLSFTTTDFTLDRDLAVLIDAPTPTISGAVRVGEELTAHRGVWLPGVSFVYSWLRDGKTITGQTASTYTLTSSDRGHAIQVRIKGTLEGNTATVTSAKTAKVGYGALTTDTPTFTWLIMVGSSVTASPGTWTAGTTLKYQWYVNGSPLSKATSATLVMPGSAYGKDISVRVTGSKSGYTTVTRQSASAPLREGTLTPATVTLSGAPQVGVSVKVTATGYTPGATLSYQWSDDNGAIVGATKSSYTPRADQRNMMLYVRVFVSKAGYAGGYTTSAVGAVLGTFSAPTPKITGTATVGSTLSVSVGTWSPNATLTYEWVRVKGSSKVTIGSDSTYTLTTAEKGWKVVVRVTGTTSNYAALTKSSSATATATVK